MSEKDVEDEIRAHMEDVRRNGPTIRGEDIDEPESCAWCGRELPYEKFNETDPVDDYCTWVLPGEDEYTPTGVEKFCGPLHLNNYVEAMLAGEDVPASESASLGEDRQ